MEIIIKDTTIKLKMSFMAFILYEEQTNKSFSPNNLSSMLRFFYCIVLASNKNLTITFDEFIDELDEHPQLLSDFSNWVIEQNNFQNQLVKDEENNKPKKKVKK